MNETNPKILIDHIDNNPLNNCLDNLRRSDTINETVKTRKKEKQKIVQIMLMLKTW
jgi:hypothetical protein